MAWLRVACFCLGLAVAGCSGMPGQGPSARDIVGQPSEEIDALYTVVDLDEHAINAMRWRPQASFASFAEYRPPGEPPLAVGDVVRVTIWEAAPGGLFNVAMNANAPVSGGQSTVIPDQVVPRAGTITVPFAGEIRVHGRSRREVEQAVAERLSLKAVEPQVMVSVVRSAANTVTVTGDAVAGAQVPLSPQGERILDAVALAGGLKAPEHETIVSLTRHGRAITLPFGTVAADIRENVRLGPGDMLVVNRRQRTFTVFGATGRNSEIPFDGPYLTLAQALARAGGLLDNRADASGVFVFRVEALEAMRKAFPNRSIKAVGGEVPVIYRLNLREPRGMFIAQAFPIRERDMIFVANAAASEFQKVLAILQTVVQPTLTGVRVADIVN